MGFSKLECWSGLPFPSPGDLPDPGSNPGLLHCRQILYHLSHQRSLNKWACAYIWVCPFVRVNMWPCTSESVFIFQYLGIAVNVCVFKYTLNLQPQALPLMFMFHSHKYTHLLTSSQQWTWYTFLLIQTCQHPCMWLQIQGILEHINMSGSACECIFFFEWISELHRGCGDICMWVSMWT